MTLVAALVHADAVHVATDSLGRRNGEPVPNFAKWLRIGDTTVVTGRGTGAMIAGVHRRLSRLAAFEDMVQAAPGALREVARELRYAPGHDLILAAGMTRDGRPQLWRLDCDCDGEALRARQVTRCVLPWGAEWGTPQIARDGAGVAELVADMRTAAAKMDPGTVGGRLMFATVSGRGIEAFATGVRLEASGASSARDGWCKAEGLACGAG